MSKRMAKYSDRYGIISTGVNRKRGQEYGLLRGLAIYRLQHVKWLNRTKKLTICGLWETTYVYTEAIKSQNAIKIKSIMEEEARELSSNIVFRLEGVCKLRGRKNKTCLSQSLAIQKMNRDWWRQMSTCYIVYEEQHEMASHSPDIWLVWFREMCSGLNNHCSNIITFESPRAQLCCTSY